MITRRNSVRGEAHRHYVYRCLYIFLFLISFYEVSSVCAQPPNPPPGWEYVRDLDSVTINDFHAVGDTIFMFGDDHRFSPKKPFYLVSYNGGKDWDSVIVPSDIAVYNTYYGFFPNEAKLFFTSLIDSSRKFYVSKDGKQYESYIVGKDTTAGMGYLEKFFIDPHNGNHWFIVGTVSVAVYKNSALFQSFDAGHTWKLVKVPVIPAEKLSLELVFDSRRSGVWYVHVIAIMHHTQPDLDTMYVVRTTDNGDFFIDVRQWGAHYGIGGSGEVRRWWGYSYQRLYGPLVGNEMDSTLLQDNWLLKFHQTLPLSDPSDGYWRWLPNYTVQFLNNDIYYPSNYLVFTKQPLAATIVEQEIRWDTVTGKSEYVTCWIHQTEDNWTTWNTIWESGPYEWANQTFLDEKTPALWTVSKFLSDTSHGGYSPDKYKSYLYKHILTLSVSQESKYGQPLMAFPSPSDGVINVLLPKKTQSVISLSLYDVLGEKLFTIGREFQFSEGKLELVLPKEIISGFYFLKIETPDSAYLVKALLRR